MSNSLPYKDFSQFISRFFSAKMQKISINAGFSCPNRDGTVGYGGCIYCNNQSFSPAYCAEKRSVTEQIGDGKRFFSRKYPSMRYLAYFQAYTSTHADTSRLISLYREALSVDGVDGIIIGTRPDCMPDDLLAELKELRKDHFVMVEYGAETASDATLTLINRCHTWAQTVDAVRRTAGAGIPVGLHLILGLPGESREDILNTIAEVSKLPVDIIKCHQLQVIRGTTLAHLIAEGKMQVPQFTLDEYIDLCCDVIRALRSDIAIERFVSQSPDELLISPRWGLKNYQFTSRLLARFSRQ